VYVAALHRIVHRACPQMIPGNHTTARETNPSRESPVLRTPDFGLRTSASSPTLHRFSLLTALATLALLGAGGLVTSHGAGMAVPDWPNTYGYNMFLFRSRSGSAASSTNTPIASPPPGSAC